MKPIFTKCKGAEELKLETQSHQSVSLLLLHFGVVSICRLGFLVLKIAVLKLPLNCHWAGFATVLFPQNNCKISQERARDRDSLQSGMLGGWVIVLLGRGWGSKWF